MLAAATLIFCTNVRISDMLSSGILDLNNNCVHNCDVIILRFCFEKNTHGDIVKQVDRIIKSNKNYRTMIDSEGIGHIRIIRRINLKILIEVFQDLYLELKKDSSRKPQISIYVSRSISDEMSENVQYFHDFAVSCLDGTFDLIVIS